jgi:hypothetical protein
MTTAAAHRHAADFDLDALTMAFTLNSRAEAYTTSYGEGECFAVAGRELLKLDPRKGPR